jgi:putative nucleotidyltransferase with HDIG domain
MKLWHRQRMGPQQVFRLGGDDALPWRERLRSPRTLAQLAILGGLFLCALLIIQLPQPRLPVRKGEKAINPILSRVAFEYTNDDVTRAVRRLAGLVQVPGLYTPDDRPVTALRDGLLAAVAAAPTLDPASETLHKDWGLDAATLAALKKTLAEKPESPAAVRDAVIAAFAPLADPRNLPIIRNEDFQRIERNLSEIEADRGRLPAEVSARLGSQFTDAAARTVLVLPAGEPPLTLDDLALLAKPDHTLSMDFVCTPGQADRVAARIERCLRPALGPVFGEAGVTALSAALAARLGTTLVYDQAATENLRRDAAETVAPIPISFRANATLIEAGKVIDDQDFKLLELEQHARRAALGWGQRLLSWLGAGVIIALLVVLMALDTLRLQANVSRSFPRSLMLALLVLVVLAASKIVAQMRGPDELCALFLVIAAMIITVAYSQVFSLALTWSTIFLVALATRADPDWIITVAVGSSVAVLALGDINNRSVLIRVGALAGLALFVAQAALAFWRLNYADTAGVTGVLWSAFLYFCVGLAAGVMLLAILPYIERAFGIVTNISLLELCDVNQPALRRVALEAPGTYTHSLLIGTLAEAAAESVGANGLLARVGACFHDIGKAAKPHFFVENWQEGENHHTGLPPATSSQLILNHVRDGLEMANRVGLPPILKQFIAEHHGTTLMAFFYREAQRQASASGGPPPQESEFRYAGPKPRSPETALVMLADAVEGATRSQTDRSADQIGRTVHDIVMNRLLDGQLDRSGLTLTDLRTAEETLTKTLLSVYHGRVPYPTGRHAGDRPDAAPKDKAAPTGAGGGTPASHTRP